MRKITVVYSFPIRLGTAGVGMTAFHQVKGLAEQGLRVHLFAGSCEKPIDGLAGLRQTLVPLAVKVPISLLGTDNSAKLHDCIVAWALARIHRKSPIDVVHCWPLGAEQTLRVARRLGIKTFLERPNTHTRYAYKVVAEECKKLGIKLQKSHSHRYNSRRLQREEREYQLADVLLCPSEFVGRTFLSEGISPRKIAYHQYGFDPERFHPPEDGRTQSNNTFDMAFVGNGDPRKGLHYALRAWGNSAAKQKGTLYICGKLLPAYRKLLGKILDSPNVKTLGYTNDVNSLLHRCRALVLPSVEEGSALVTYEARACGCVLLVSDASGAHCTHMYDGLVHPAGDVATLKDHIDLITSDEHTYERLRRNSLSQAAQFTWAKAAERLVEIYRDTLAER